MGEGRRDLRKEKGRLKEGRVQDPVKDQQRVHKPVYLLWILHPSLQGVSCPNKYLVSPFLSLYFVSLGVQLLFPSVKAVDTWAVSPGLRLAHCPTVAQAGLELAAILSAELQACAPVPDCLRLLIRFLSML